MSIKYKILTSTFVFSTLFIGIETHAACPPLNGFRPVDISMSVGRVVVRPSDAVGTVLRKATFPIAPNGSNYRCDSRGGTIIAKLTQNYTLSASGNSIYNTNIEGIGIRLYREAEELNADKFSGHYPYTRPLTANQPYRLSSGFFVVEIIKTAPSTGSGTLVPGQYSSYYAEGSANLPFLTSTVYGNAITIASSSCEIQGNINKVVQLPTVTKAGFKGIGSTQGEQAFDLNILCNGGKNQTGYEESNKISLSFDYNLAANTNNVLANDAPVATRANGVGIQLLSKYNNQNKIIVKSEKLPIGTLKSNQSIQYNIPMTARYYQTQANIRAGKVRSMATVTVEYD